MVGYLSKYSQFTLEQHSKLSAVALYGNSFYEIEICISENSVIKIKQPKRAYSRKWNFERYLR